MSVTLRELKGQQLVDVEVDDGIAKLTFESGHWLKCDFRDLWCGHGESSRSSPELRQFLQEMKQRRVAQEAKP